jgi:hypothetical protein
MEKHEASIRKALGYPLEVNLEMVAKIIEASNNPGDIILGAFWSRYFSIRTVY